MNDNRFIYDELQQVGVDYTDLEEVKRYDERHKKLRDIEGEIKDLMQKTSPGPDSVALEIGIGTGEFTMAMARRCKRVFALDVSPLMIEYAQKKMNSIHIENVEFHHAGFLTYKHKAEPVDLAYSQLALHHLPDFWKSIALKNINGWLKPGGTFWLKDVIYPSHITDFDAFFAKIVKGIEDSISAELTKEFIDHIRKEHSTLEWIMDELIIRSGFSIKQKNLESDFIISYLCKKSGQ